MVSFVIYFHSDRIENLKQTLRFLFAGQRIKKEVILVCNDKTEEEFVGCRLINLDLPDYKKPVMCNLGVREAEGELVVLLDSDRILPDGYFSRASKDINRGEFVSCTRMLNLDSEYTDRDILGGAFEFSEELRSESWELWRKNLFSGNTMFHKADYLECGGMDESFVGYGFADNDMTRTVLSRGFKAKWMNEDEIHLDHPKEFLESGEVMGVERRRQVTHNNMCKFLKKWKMKEYLKMCTCSM